MEYRRTMLCYNRNGYEFTCNISISGNQSVIYVVCICSRINSSKVSSSGGGLSSVVSIGYETVENNTRIHFYKSGGWLGYIKLT